MLFLNIFGVVGKSLLCGFVIIIGFFIRYYNYVMVVTILVVTTSFINVIVFRKVYKGCCSYYIC